LIASSPVFMAAMILPINAWKDPQSPRDLGLVFTTVSTLKTQQERHLLIDALITCSDQTRVCSLGVYVCHSSTLSRKINHLYSLHCACAAAFARSTRAAGLSDL
jgi:hypothetical protein